MLVNVLVHHRNGTFDQDIRRGQLVGHGPLASFTGQDRLILIVQQHITLVALDKCVSGFPGILWQHIDIFIDSCDVFTGSVLTAPLLGD